MLFRPRRASCWRDDDADVDAVDVGADGPWSGWAQCVLKTTAANYEETQTHTWRITGGPPRVTGSTRHWPAVWNVQGSGQRLISSGNPGAAAITANTGGPSESWTIAVPETGRTGRVLGGSGHRPAQDRIATRTAHRTRRDHGERELPVRRLRPARSVNGNSLRSPAVSLPRRSRAVRQPRADSSSRWGGSVRIRR